MIINPIETTNFAGVLSMRLLPRAGRLKSCDVYFTKIFMEIKNNCTCWCMILLDRPQIFGFVDQHFLRMDSELAVYALNVRLGCID